jgi:hypothetical protein
MEGEAGQIREGAMGSALNVLKTTAHMQPKLRARYRKEGGKNEKNERKKKKRMQGMKDQNNLTTIKYSNQFHAADDVSVIHESTHM